MRAGATLFIGGTAEDLRVERLAALIEALGVRPLLVHVTVPKGGGPPVGHSFARFRTRTEADRVRLALRGVLLDGRPLRVEWARTEAETGFVYDGLSWRTGRIGLYGEPTR